MVLKARDFLSQHRRLVLIASSILVFVSLVLTFKRPSTSTKVPIAAHSNSIPSFPPPLPLFEDFEHPIEQLMRDADEKIEKIKAAETHSLAEAAAAYRTRRGRHPPPGFDIWYKFATDNDATIIEEFYDQIYESIEPFWSLEPSFLRDFPRTWPRTITVRDGVAYPRSRISSWMLNIMVDMVNHLPSLPDLDFAFLDGDEPRNLVSFEKMQEYIKKSAELRMQHNLIPMGQMNNTWPKYHQMNYDIPEREPEERKTSWGNDTTFWDLLIKACRPDDPANLYPESVPKHNVPPVFSTNYTVGTVKGYVANYTTARNPCHNPNLRTLHGWMINPFSTDFYTELVPIFTVTKIVGVTNDILVPATTHFEQGIYSGLEYTIPWKQKKNSAFWRGTANGGNHTKENWWGFHRHRLLQLMNGTVQSQVEAELKASGLENASMQALNSLDPEHFELGLHNFPFPLRHLYAIAAQSYGKLGQWIGSFSDGGLTNAFCSRWHYLTAQKACDHTDNYYAIVNQVNTTEMLSYKYLPDVDGFTSSGRFIGFLRSLSVPIKASIFGEWHDDRVIPWRHFVPMSVENQEWWGIMQYFMGYKGDEGEITISGHDEVAEKIGRQGSEWSHHVERRENILIYLHRVLLEYARISSDERIHMGYVDDLPKKR